MNHPTGIIGSGAMGAGIAQVAAQAGHTVVVYDNNQQALIKSEATLKATLRKLQEKGKLASADEIIARLSFTNNLNDLADCMLVIEAIVKTWTSKNRCLPRWSSKCAMSAFSPPTPLRYPLPALRRPAAIQSACWACTSSIPHR